MSKIALPFILLLTIVVIVEANNSSVQQSQPTLPYHIISAESGDVNLRLKCPIQKGPHAGVIWIFQNKNLLIGASVDYNFTKYRYLASTGELLIREVENSDSGIYNCILKKKIYFSNLEQIQLELGSLKLSVSVEYANWWEKEYHENSLKCAVALGLIAGTLVVSICLLCSCCCCNESEAKTKAKRNSSAEDVQIKGNRGEYNLPTTATFPIVEIGAPVPIIIESGAEDAIVVQLPKPINSPTMANKEKSEVPPTTVTEELEEKFQGVLNNDEAHGKSSQGFRKVSKAAVLQCLSNNSSNFNPTVEQGESVSIGVNTDHTTITTIGSTIIYVTPAD